MEERLVCFEVVIIYKLVSERIIKLFLCECIFVEVFLVNFILVLNFCFHSSEDTVVLLRPALNIGKEDVETLGVKNIEVLVCKISLISCNQLVQDS